ncbi:MAG: hypothetical protein WBG42_01145 [Cryomorphaceae bacterium]
MDLESRKISFIQEFLRLQNEDIIEGLESLLRKKKAEYVEKNLGPMSVEQFNEEIDQAMNQSKNGQVTKAEDLLKKYEK